MEGDDEVTEALKSFDDVLQDEQDALAKRIEKVKPMMQMNIILIFRT